MTARRRGSAKRQRRDRPGAQRLPLTPGIQSVPARGTRAIAAASRGLAGAHTEVAERLPKALIHRNVPGERIREFLQAMDRAWLEAAPLATFGHQQRWTAMCCALRDGGWPVRDGASRWRLGELTVGWEAVAPGA